MMKVISLYWKENNKYFPKLHIVGKKMWTLKEKFVNVLGKKIDIFIHHFEIDYFKPVLFVFELFSTPSFY